MKKIMGSIWMKALAMLLAVITGIAAIICGIATVGFGVTAVNERSLQAIETAVCDRLYQTYAAALMTEYFEGGESTSSLKGLDGGNIHYTVVKYEYEYGKEDDAQPEILYSNDSSVGENSYSIAFSDVWGWTYRYSAESFQEMMYGYDSKGYAITDDGLDEGDEDEDGYTMVYVYMSPDENVLEDVTLCNGMADYTYEAQNLAYRIYNFSTTSGWWFAGSLALFLFFFVFLMRAAGRRTADNELHTRWTDRIPFGICTAAVCGFALFGLFMALWMAEILEVYSISFVFFVVCEVLALGAVLLVLLVYCMTIAVRIRTKTFWRYTLVHDVFKCVRIIGGVIQKNVPFFVKGVLLFAGVAFAETIFVGVTWEGSRIGQSCVFLMIKLVELLAFFYILYQMNLILRGGKRIAAGDYSQPIRTDGMFWELKKHAENINNVGDGISIAVAERMKSERFKTELITNVSHDIKTPLTSIINYVDLMKKEDIESPTMQEYVEVLDRQSVRLKKLIEDLMEASKASSGSLPVNLEVCDATVMLSQIVGEFEEQARENNLEIVAKYPAPPVEIMADGRHLWRVLDNLMGNACKYGMPGTRVYIDLEVFNGMVIMTFRNISKYRINLSSEELMERFVRGDSSRNTTGSGLGLSIAQSLTALMNGNMAIQTDGDLFKAIVSFDQVRQ